MNKQEILDAINATIAPNNIKGITAESLNNVLTMMAENAGEGGSGVVTFYAPSGETATDEEKAKNAEAFNSYQVGSMVVVCDNASQLTMSAAQSILNTDFIDVFVYEYTGNGAVEPIEFLFYNDGSVTIQ